MGVFFDYGFTFSFDFSVLSLFRSRLLNGNQEKLLLDKLLERCQQLKLIKAQGKARTDSTHILAAIRNLNRLELNQVHLITNVHTTQAHLTDVDQTQEIHQSLAEKELLPKQHLVDAGYVDGTLLVESQQKYELELLGPVRDNVSWQSKQPDAYDISRFKINWKTRQATCPQGVKSTKKWTVHKDAWDNTVITIKFPQKARP